MRRIAAIAVVLTVLSGCGGEDKPAASKPERAATTDWRATADSACTRATDRLVSSGWQFNLKRLRRGLPPIVRDVRAGIAETQKLSGRPDQEFVADMAALEPRFAELLRASKTLKVRPLDRAITRLEVKLRALATSARRAGLRECVQAEVPRRIVNVLRAPVASEQLALIFKRTNPRLDAAEEAAKVDSTHVQGLRDYASVLGDREAAVRAIKVPRWAKRERAAYLAALHAYRLGIDELADRHAAGTDTPDAELEKLIRRPEKRMNRKIERLWGGMGARPTTKI